MKNSIVWLHAESIAQRAREIMAANDTNDLASIEKGVLIYLENIASNCEAIKAEIAKAKQPA